MSLRKFKILVVEDEKYTRMPLCFILRNNGFYVIEVSNSDEALKEIQKNNAKNESFDLLIIDIETSSFAGLKLIEEHNTNIPWIGISCSCYKQMQSKLKSLGCIGLLNKPFEPKEVLSTISSLFKNNNY